MGDYISWDTDFPQPKKGGSGGGGRSGSSIFLRLEANKPRRIRPVHKPFMYYKMFNKVENELRTAIIADPERSTLKDKYPQIRPNRKFAMVVFDRDDENKLKIFEFGSTVFDELKSFKNITKQEPGGAGGADITVTKVLAPGAPLRDTEYRVKFEERTPFTAEELQLLKSEEVVEKYNLKKVFSPQTDDEAEEILFAEVDPRKKQRDKGDQPAPQAQSQAQPAATVTAPAPAAQEEDPFNWG